METLYRKIAVSERLPKAKEMLMTSHGWSLWNGHQFEDEDDKPISYINYWLEEITDHSAQLQADKAELVSYLEHVLFYVFWNGGNLNLKDKERIESLIQKHK